MKQFSFLKMFLILILPITLSYKNAQAMRNPAAVYCEEMGYEYRIEKGPKGGQVGFVIIDGEKYNAWDFFKGKVRQDRSFCAKNGYETITESNGESPFSPEYAVCVGEKTIQKRGRSYKVKERIPMHKMMNLETKIQDITEEEMQFTPEKSTIPKDEQYTATTEELPAYFDWRNKNGKNWMTSVKDQGPWALCQTFAVTGALEGVENIKKPILPFPNPDLSEQELPCEGIVDYYRGGSIGNVIDYIMLEGVVEEGVLPYEGPSSSCNIPENATRHFIQARGPPISPWPLQDPVAIINATKRAIIEKGPLVANMYMSGHFDENNIYKCDGVHKNAHSVVIVGWNDTGNPETSYLIAKMPWGVNYNQDGYINVGLNDILPDGRIYPQCDLGVAPSAYLVIPSPEEDTNYLKNMIKGLQVMSGIEVEDNEFTDYVRDGKIDMKDIIYSGQKAAELR